MLLTDHVDNPPAGALAGRSVGAVIAAPGRSGDGKVSRFRFGTTKVDGVP
jgi:hypothetical protein